MAKKKTRTAVGQAGQVRQAGRTGTARVAAGATPRPGAATETAAKTVVETVSKTATETAIPPEKLPGAEQVPGAGAGKLPVGAGRILVGDCLASMAGLPEGSVDLIFADPPYNIGYQYDTYEDTLEDEQYVAWTCDWIDACVRLLSPSGSFYILIGDEYAAQTRMHLRSLEKEKKLVFRNWIIWHYTFGQNCKAKFNRSHAHLFYCVGSAAAGGGVKVSDLPFTFNRDAIAVPSARQTTYADARANPQGKLPDDTWYLRPQETAGHYFREDEDTWYVSRLCGTFKERQGWHPCQLPEALLERIVKLSSNEGDVVFDPFTGSGTTLAVAARLGRRWLGCELSQEYAVRALERVKHSQETGDTHTVSSDVKGVKAGRASGRKKARQGKQGQGQGKAGAAGAAAAAVVHAKVTKRPKKTAAR